jgi:ADP-heptose:LPS heptosyltransferase
MKWTHGGKAGDLIWSLPTMRALAPGQRCTIVMSQKYAWYPIELLVQQLEPLLLRQPYIDKVVIDTRGIAGTLEGYTTGDYWWLDDFRSGKLRPDGTWNLASLVSRAHNLPDSVLTGAWLSILPKRKAKYVVARNCQATCRNSMMPWRQIADEIRGQAVFLGHSAEHVEFVRHFGHIDFYPTENLEEAAAIIAGADSIFCNQSVLHAMAEAMKKPILLEVSLDFPSVLWHRSQVFNAWQEYPDGWRDLLFR